MIFQKENIDIELLKRICKILRHNIFKEISNEYEATNR